MSKTKKAWLLSLSGLALIAIVLLSAGLPGLTLQPSQYVLERQPREVGAAILDELIGPDLSGLIRLIGPILLFVIGPSALIYLLISPQARRQVFRFLIPLLVLLALVLVYMNNPPVIPEIELSPQPQGEPGYPELVDPTPTPAIDPPPWLVFGVSFLTVFLLAWGGWLIYTRYFRPTTLQEIARQAREALDEIHAGVDLRDTITRCYYEMSQTLYKQRGVRRQQAMTPREFELQLHQSGLPQNHIHQLTRLFEKVRYGDATPSEEDERLAIESLTAIVETAARPNHTTEAAEQTT